MFVEAALARWSDRRLATTLGLVLFVTTAWPVLLLKVAPYQDLPGHLATVTVLAHPERYPDFLPNGWLKSNMALVAWTYFVGKIVGIERAARIFVLATLGSTAFVLPRFVLHFTDRRRMLVSAPLVWPMVQNWFVSMGMLNFALGSALAAALLVLLDRQRVAPTAPRAVAIVILGAVIWFASAIPLVIVGVLLLIEVLRRPSWAERAGAARKLFPPMVPAMGLVAMVAVTHTSHVGDNHFGAVESVTYEPPLWSVYDIWAHWFYGFTELEAVTLLPAAVLAAVALLRLREPVPMFSPVALLCLVVLYFSGPFMMPGFGFVKDRVLPFLWMAALVRVPRQLPRYSWEVLVSAGALNAVGLAIDMFRVAADLDLYAAGIEDVPVGSRLLALTFNTRLTSKNVWTLRHASGMYVVERLTNAQDVWADSPTMPLRFRQEPTFFEDQLQVARFVESVATRAHYCDMKRAEGLAFDDCVSEWRAQWRWLWSEAERRFDRVLLFAPTEDALQEVPGQWQPAVRVGPLWLLQPRAVAAGSAH
jgi:hypothetical protein